MNEITRRLYGRSRRSQFTKRADGKAARNRVNQMSREFELRKVDSERTRKLEEGRIKFAAPVLRSLVEIENVVRSKPKSPVYVIKVDEPISKIGTAMFGEDSYNRVKTSKAEGIGPHFDAYARDFTPWTLHVNHGRLGTVRGAFLPEETWSTYLEETDNMQRSGANEQRKRFELGKILFNEGIDLHTARLQEGTMTMLWHGDVSRPDLPPPGIHEYIHSPMVLVNLERSEGSYTIYARQHTSDKFEGFTEV